MASHNFLKNLVQDTKIGHWPVIVHDILFEGGLFQEATREQYISAIHLNIPLEHVAGVPNR